MDLMDGSHISPLAQPFPMILALNDLFQNDSQNAEIWRPQPTQSRLTRNIKAVFKAFYFLCFSSDRISPAALLELSVLLWLSSLPQRGFGQRGLAILFIGPGGSLWQAGLIGMVSGLRRRAFYSVFVSSRHILTLHVVLRGHLCVCARLWKWGLLGGGGCLYRGSFFKFLTVTVVLKCSVLSLNVLFAEN